MLREIDWGKWYDGMHSSVSHLERAYSPARLLEVLAAHLPQDRNARVLELGCAPGRWLAWTGLRLGVRGFGIELDEKGLSLTRSLYPGMPLTRADAFHLPFADGVFDAVYSIGLIEHFDDPNKILVEARRVLRPDGVAIWEVPNLESGSFCTWHWRRVKRYNYEAHRPYSLGELAATVSRAGFIVSHQEYVGLYLPHLQRILGRLPFKSWFRRLERPSLASYLIVIARAA